MTGSNTTIGGVDFGPLDLASIIPSGPMSANIWFADGFGTWFGTGNGTTQPDATWTWDATNEWMQLAIPGAGGTGLAEFRYRGDFSRAGAADAFQLNQFLPGVLTITGATPQTSTALFAFLATAVVNTPALTDLWTVSVPQPTASGTITRPAAIAAESGSGRTAFFVSSAIANGAGFNFALGIGAGLSHGGVVATRVSSALYMGLVGPGSSGQNAGIICHGKDHVLVTADVGLYAYADREIGWTPNAVSGWGTFTAPTPVSGIDWSTAQTEDGLVWGMAANASLLMVAYANRNNDYAAAAATNPTLYIFSATAAATATDEWISLTHNVTDGVISVGSGNVLIGGTSSLAVAATARIYLDGGGDTYWTEAAANSAQLFTGGTLRVAVGTSSILARIAVRGPDASAALPSFSWETDADSGIYRIGADNWACSAGGSKILEFLNDGALKMGFFGLATPVIKPTVSGARSDAVAGSIVDALAALGLVTDSTT